MPLGGGTFTTQNKISPGTYINFVSTANSSSSNSERGYCTMPLELDWGVEDEIFTVDTDTLKKNCLTIFGYEYTDDKLKGIRDLFLNAKTLYGYRLNGGGVKASNTYATAKYSGIRGNDLTIVITNSVDNVGSYIVKTLLDNEEMDTQTVTEASGLIDNDWVTFITTATLAETAGEHLTGGTNGTVTGSSYQTYLNKIESYSFNILGCTTTDDTIKSLIVSFCERMRDEAGVKFQVVLHDKAADYEGVINLVNEVTEEDGFNKASLVYFITGIEASCAVNASCLNKTYTGEFDVLADYTVAEIEDAITNGKLILHRDGNDINISEDINSLVTYTDEKGDIFSNNQSIRVIDQIATDIASIFNKSYIGKVQNNDSGRELLWNDITKHHEELAGLGAIEDFDSSDVTVSAGESKNSVVVEDVITIVGTMSKLYMTVTVN